MRRRRATKREVIPDPLYNSKLVSKFINVVMERGKRSIAETIVYDSLEILKKKTGKDEALELLQKAFDNVRPLLELKPRRVGGATYQVPVEVNNERGTAIAMRWMRNFARQHRGGPMSQRLAQELFDAYNKQGSTLKKKDDTHKMAEANKAFSHFRW